MTVPFTSSDRDAWVNLIAQAERLQNPKVVDFGPLRKAEMRCTDKVLPPVFQGQPGNPFGRLRHMVRNLPRDDADARARVIAQAATCRAVLPPSETPGDFGQLTHLHDRRRDIYG